jgi:hypothetical protein
MEYSETKKHNDTTTRAARPGGLAWLRYPVYATAGMAGMFLLYRSLGLYQAAFADWGLGQIAAVCGPMAGTPLIGGLIAGGCGQIAGIVTGLIVLMVLLVLTILQSMPTLLWFHPQTITRMVDQLRANRRYRKTLATDGSDSAEVRTLVTRHNSISSDKNLRTLMVFSVLAFALEGWIIWTARQGTASLTAVLVDSLAFECLVTAALSFAAVFRPVPQSGRHYGE